MDNIKKMVTILATVIISMLIIPLIAVNTVKSDAGMLVTMLLFFAVNPFVSIWTGIIAGKNIKNFWFTPILLAVLFWVFSSITYNTAFPVVYSAIYFAVCCISMFITWCVQRTK